MRSDTPWEYCNCNCHNHPEGTVMHVFACCLQCPHCGVNIVRGCEDHFDRCKAEYQSMGLPTDQYLTIAGRGLTIFDQIRDEIDQEVLAEMIADIGRARREVSPAIKFLRECQERERKLGK